MTNKLTQCLKSRYQFFLFEGIQHKIYAGFKHANFKKVFVANVDYAYLTHGDDLEEILDKCIGWLKKNEPR